MGEIAKRARAFVVMSFDDEFIDTFEFGIKGACSARGYDCVRVDKKAHDNLIINQIYEEIRQADVVISEMSNPSPNVYFETGYALAAGKRLILLTKRADSIPFDLQQYQHIVYPSVFALRRELEARLTWAATAPKPEPAASSDPDFSQPAKLRPANSYWLGHDLLWTMYYAQQPTSTVRLLWYGAALCVEHATLLTLNEAAVGYMPLKRQCDELRKLRGELGDDATVPDENRKALISALSKAVHVLGQELTTYQGTYNKPQDPELFEIWAELKATGRGDDLFE